MSRINELECHESSGQILANVWYSDMLLSIRSSDGAVTDVIDAASMYSYEPSDGEPDDCTAHHEVINGIARDPDSGDLWVTGKLWGCLFKVNVVDSDTGQARSPWVAQAFYDTEAPETISTTTTVQIAAITTTMPPTAAPSTSPTARPTTSPTAKPTTSPTAQPTPAPHAQVASEGDDDETSTSVPKTTVRRRPGVVSTSTPEATTSTEPFTRTRPTQPRPLSDDAIVDDDGEEGGVVSSLDAFGSTMKSRATVVVAMAFVAVVVALVVLAVVQRKRKCVSSLQPPQSQRQLDTCRTPLTASTTGTPPPPPHSPTREHPPTHKHEAHQCS
jgi:hypothetical protein